MRNLFSYIEDFRIDDMNHIFKWILDNTIFYFPNHKFRNMNLLNHFQSIFISNLPYKIKLHLVFSSLLIKSSNIDDSYIEIKTSSLNLNVNLVKIDARQLIGYPSQRNSKLALNGSISANKKEHILSNPTISEIQALTPCIIYIDNLDLMLQPTDESEERIYNNIATTYLASLEQFLNDLKLFVSSKSNNELLENIIYVTTSVDSFENSHLLLQSLFPITYETKCYSKTDIVSILAELSIENEDKLVTRLFSITRGSPSMLNDIINQSKAIHYQRIHQNEWFEFLDLNILAENDTNDNSELNINDIIECLSTFELKSMNNTSKIADLNITPTYWADIGGLDRVRQEILNMIQSTNHRQYRRGILLFGPPGQ